MLTVDLYILYKVDGRWQKLLKSARLVARRFCSFVPPALKGQFCGDRLGHRDSPGCREGYFFGASEQVSGSQQRSPDIVS